MVTLRYWLLIGAVLAFSAGSVACNRATPPVAEPEPSPLPSPVVQRTSPSIGLVGTASCAGRSCHGSLEPTERALSWQMEYTLWTSHDPHQRAYQVLFE